MSKKLFVGNLSWNLTEADLRKAFEKYGEIEELVILLDRETQRSRGFGFVTFAQDEQADQAIAELNGKEFDGREIAVNEARPKK